MRADPITLGSDRTAGPVRAGQRVATDKPGEQVVLGQLKEAIVLRAQQRRIARQFRKHLGYSGNFENPSTYQEKVQFRKLYGNHPFYARVTDKYGVRQYVAAKVGAQYLIPLLGVYERLHRSVFEHLPDQFIIKAAHGCKWNQVVRDKARLDVPATVRHFNKLCRRRYGWIAGERHYNLIPPRIVIETLLQDDLGGGLPWDYNFFCYNGPNGFEYSLAIASPEGQGAQFDKQWNLLEPSQIPQDALAPHANPAEFREMLQVAAALSADFDFVRVDLYRAGGRVFFGELTCTPHQGYGPIRNPIRQRMRDEMWHLDARNELLYRAPASSRKAHHSRTPATPATPGLPV